MVIEVSGLSRAAGGKGCQAELCRIAADILRNKPGLYQHGPEVADIVVRFVIVHLFRWARPQTEGGEFQEALASPGGHVDQAQAAILENTMDFHQGLQWIV